MAPSIIFNDAVQGEVFLPGQIFVFGGFVLRANSLGHLEQIESYVPSHQVRFGSLNYTTDIRGDLIFDVFEPMPGPPHSHDEHDLALPPDGVWEITPVATPALNPEQIVPSEDRWMETATEAAHPAAIEPNTDFTSYETRVAGSSDPSRPQAPNRLRPCISNLIGRRSWSLPPRIYFSTHPWATC